MKNKRSKDPIGLGFALTGVMTALKTEFNMRIHLIIMIVVILSGILFHISVLEWLFVMLAIGFVLALELVNTVIELLTDELFKEEHETAKNIKDISAAAVLVAAIFAAIVGVIIFLPKVIYILN
ncbi:diacylglycerol kinase family protein [Allobacillus sp. GCM10007491]|uniref:Diacylglycerol kinase family protein n=2 Tax=Allobacillus TaxID=1400133 RepID=A0A941CW98_9BACI|nr:MULTISPECIES: diacylglycerol kinase family protein [Allobacillus]MBR7554331.1 diacylglycerol kinase family protein [Allobacillus saliphilus]TSJ67740.1 diacylglycerol kinase family protein [Allobacillus salarius]